MKPSTHKIILTCLIVGVLLASCATTEMVNMWRNDAYHGAPLQSVLVVGMTKNVTNRHSFEDAFVKELHEVGIKGTASYSFFSDEDYSGNTFNKKEMTAVAKEAGFDGVIMSRLVSIDNRSRYVPGYSAVMPGYSGGPFGPVWEGWYEEVYEPGYYVNDRVARVETQVWSARGKSQLLWTGLSETIDPTSIGKSGRELAKIIIKELKKAKLL